MQNKNTAFYMRDSKIDKKNRLELARRLGVKSEAEAIRLAVAMALKAHTLPRRDLRLSPRKTASPSAAMIAQAN